MTEAIHATVDAIETCEVLVPRSARNRISTSYAVLPDAHHVLVRVRVGDVVGIGEAPAELWWTGEDATSVRNAIERYLAPALLGGPAEPRAACVRMDAALAANTYAKAALEMALWDAIGRSAGLPLCTLLGGGPTPVPIKFVMGMITPEEAREESLRGIEQGFSVLKVKVGGDLHEDVARLEAVLDAAAGAAEVGVDANGGWTPIEAQRALPILSGLGIVFLEQPVDRRLPHAMREITARSEIPVVAHESLFTLRDGADAARDPIAHIWALTPSTHGGLVPTLDLLGTARTLGLPCLLGSTVELGVATAFMAHIGAAFETIHRCPVPSDVIGPLYHDDDIVTNPVVLTGGFARVPDGPGLGVELDDERVAAHTVSAWR
jgi:L-alanine-DL-glutamate epimerase-like enolase superfamily enzyme